MPTSFKKRTVQLIRKAGVLRPRDLDKHGIPRQYLRILQQNGQIHRSGRGLYMLKGADVTENHTIAEACKKVPNGVVCLVSALRFHGLTTQLPHEVWMAIERKSRKPVTDNPPLRIVRFSGDAMKEGVEHRMIEGVAVKLYGPGKTVADCFKYRNKIGLDIAIEALRDCWRGKKATMDQLWAAAKICRVARVIQPYLESLT